MATRATPTRAVAPPIQIHEGLFDMNEPGITPRPWRAHTSPASVMRTPKTMAMMRMHSGLDGETQALAHAGPSSVEGRGDSAAGHHEALVLAPAPVQFLDL